MVVVVVVVIVVVVVVEIVVVLIVVVVVVVVVVVIISLSHCLQVDARSRGLSSGVCCDYSPSFLLDDFFGPIRGLSASPSCVYRRCLQYS